MVQIFACSSDSSISFFNNVSVANDRGSKAEDGHADTATPVKGNAAEISARRAEHMWLFPTA